MAAAIGPAIGVGSSIIGGIQGKGAQKRAEQLQRQQLAMLQPLLQEEAALTRFSGEQARSLFPQATNSLNSILNQSLGQVEPLLKDYRAMLGQGQAGQDKLFQQGDQLRQLGLNELSSASPYFEGARAGLGDLQRFYRPFMFDGQRAIEKFLPSQANLQKLMAGDFANVNQGFKSASENIANFAPRGGGRVSTMANADVNRQQQLTQLGAQGRQNYLQTGLQSAFQGAQGQQGVSQALAQLGLGKGQLGLGQIGAGQQSQQLGISEFGSKANVGLNQLSQALQALGLAGGAAGNLGQLASSTLGQGMAGGQKAFDLFNQTANRNTSMDLQRLRNSQGTMGLGGFLVDLFNNKGTQNFLGGLFGGGGKQDKLPGYDF